MDWNRAIEINHAALTRIVAALIAMVGLSSGGALGRLPKPLYRAVTGVLHRAESAVRRLIVIAARGLKVNPLPIRPMPKGLVLVGNSGGRISFQLFDQRQNFGRVRRRTVPAKVEPRIHFFDASPLVPLFQRRPVESSIPEPDDSVDAQRLARRLAAVKLALETLPRQAKRVARWKTRRAGMQRPTFTSPLRPGPPPGHRKEPKDEVDRVLRECHGLARDALREDTS